MPETRCSLLTPQLLDEVRGTFLSAEPDVPALRQRISDALEVSSEDAAALIYQVVAQLNGSLFPSLTHLELVHTDGCNLACRYCFEKTIHGREMMSEHVARAAIDLLFDCSGDAPRLEITHFGGEPTLNYPGIRAATEYAEQKARAREKSVAFDLTTNGILLNQSMVEYFAAHEIQALLSIDGLQTSHDRFRVDRRGRGTFSRVMRGLEILKRTQPWIGAKMTIMPENVDSLFTDVVGLVACGINHFFVGHATGVDWPEPSIARFEEELGKLSCWYGSQPRDKVRIDGFDGSEGGCGFGCRAGRNGIAVTVDGEVYPCSKVLGTAKGHLPGRLGDVWYGLTHFRNRGELVRCLRLKAACEQAGIAGEYQGGCFAVNYEDTGDLLRPSLREHRFSLLRQRVLGGPLRGNP